jgi:chromosome segregation ATPase
MAGQEFDAGADIACFRSASLRGNPEIEGAVATARRTVIARTREAATEKFAARAAIAQREAELLAERQQSERLAARNVQVTQERDEAQQEASSRRGELAAARVELARSAMEGDGHQREVARVIRELQEVRDRVTELAAERETLSIERERLRADVARLTQEAAQLRTNSGAAVAQAGNEKDAARKETVSFCHPK